jgi:hypothetical protein
MRRVLRLITLVRDTANTRGETAVVVDTTPTGSRTVDTGALAAIEAELGTELHDDVLIVLAARIPMLTVATGLELDGLLDRVGEVEVPSDWVSVALVSDDPFAARRSRGESGGDVSDLCVPVPARAESMVGIAHKRRVHVDPLAFPPWVEDQLRLELGRRSDWLELLAKIVLVTELPTFALSGSASELPPAAVRRVIHDKFGVGTVVRALEGGKLVIAFADGERTLLARVLRDV